MKRHLLIAAFSAGACATDVPLDLELGPPSGAVDPGDPPPASTVGEFGWARNFSRPGDSSSVAVAWNGEAAVVVGGSYGGLDQELNNPLPGDTLEHPGSIDLGGGTVSTSEWGMGFVASYSAGDGSPIWAHAFTSDGTGGVLGPWSSIDDVVVAEHGELLTAGSFEGSVDLGGGLVASAQGGEGFVARYGADGALLDLWTVPTLWVGQVARMDDGGVIVAGQGADPTETLVSQKLLRLDSAGEMVWQLALSGGASIASIAVRADGNIALAGSLGEGGLEIAGMRLESSDPSAGQPYVALVSPAGDGIWARTFTRGTESTHVELGDIVIGEDDRLFATGLFAGAVDFGGGSTDSGRPLPDDWHYHDLYLVELDADGEFAGLATIPTQDGAMVEGRSIAIGPGGDLLVAGQVIGELDLGQDRLVSGGFSARFEGLELRALQQMTVARELGDGLPFEIAVAPDGQIAAVGFFGGTVDFGGGPVATDGVEFNPDNDGYVSVYRPRSVESVH